MPVFLFLINAAALVLMFLDKQFAKKKIRRIPEAVLLGAAFLGGSLGALLGMYLFHHKTRKPKFFILIPFFLAVQLFLLIRYTG